MGLRDAVSESVGFASQEWNPRMGLRDAASESVGFASQEWNPRMGLHDAAKRIRRIRRSVSLRRVGYRRRLGIAKLGEFFAHRAVGARNDRPGK